MSVPSASFRASQPPASPGGFSYLLLSPGPDSTIPLILPTFSSHPSKQPCSLPSVHPPTLSTCCHHSPTGAPRPPEAFRVTPVYGFSTFGWPLLWEPTHLLLGSCVTLCCHLVSRCTSLLSPVRGRTPKGRTQSFCIPRKW